MLLSRTTQHGVIVSGYIVHTVRCALRLIYRARRRGGEEGVVGYFSAIVPAPPHWSLLRVVFQ